MPRIVYHGTFADEPPHRIEQDTFHAGTWKAALDRLDDQFDHGIDWEESGGVGIARVHAYEISDTAPMSRKTWSDSTAEYEEGDARNIVPEHKTNRIYPYTNLIEDAGSTSYVIPRHFVGKPFVKHLGVQFQQVVGGDDAEKAITNAISAMSGGKKG